MQNSGKKPNKGRRTFAESKQKMSRRKPKTERHVELSSSQKALADRLSEIKGRIECFLDEDDVKKILDVVSERPLWLGANGDRIAKLLKLEYNFSERLAIDASLVIEQTAPVSAVKVSSKPPLKEDESSDDDEEGDDDSDEGSSEEDNDGEAMCFEGHSQQEAKAFSTHTKTNVTPKLAHGGNDGKRRHNVELPKGYNMKSKVPNCREEDSSSYESSSDEEQPPRRPAKEVSRSPDSSSYESSSDEEQPRKPAKEVIRSPDSSSYESSSDEEHPRKPAAKEVTRKTAVNVKAGEEDSSSDESESNEEPKLKKTKVQVSANFTHKNKDENYAASVAANIYSKEENDMFTIKTPSRSEFRKQNKETCSSTDQGQTGIIFVKNLPYSVDESSVEEYFQTAGDVKEVRLAKRSDGRLCGFAHIEFYTEEAANRACMKSGETFYGREIFVDKAISQSRGRRNSSKLIGVNGTDQNSGSQATAYVTGFDKYLDENTIRTSLADMFKNCSVKNVRLPKYEESGNVKGFALIDFNDKHGLSKAIQYDGSDFYGCPLIVEKSHASGGPVRARDGSQGGRGHGHGRRGGRRGGRGYAG